MREYNRVIWYYKLSWQHKLATKKSFKADISSFSPSITQSIILNYPVPCTHIALLYHYTLCCFVEDMIPPVETKLITSIIANLIVKKRNTRNLIKYINKLQGERDREVTNSAVKKEWGIIRWIPLQVHSLEHCFTAFEDFICIIVSQLQEKVKTVVKMF